MFKDYYKVIGSRYKFKLEDLINKQGDKGLTREKFINFKEKLSANYLHERNSENIA